MNEHELNKLLESEVQKNTDLKSVNTKNFQKKLKHSINRTVYTRVFTVLLAISILAVTLYYGSSALISTLFYNPKQEPAFLTKETDEPPREFGLLLTDFINMHFPNVTAYVIHNDNFSPYTKKGFGCYDVDVKLFQSLDPIILSDDSANHLRIKWSKLKSVRGPLLLYHSLNEFKNPDPSVGFQPGMPTPETIRNEIEKLPDSAWLDVSLSFEQYLSSDEVATLINECPDSTFKWIALKDQNFSLTPKVAYGMNLYTISKDEFTKQAMDKYPFYYLDTEKISGKLLETNYQSHLQLMIDHPEFVKLMSTLFGKDITVENFKKRLESTKKEWKAYGVRVDIGKDALLDLMSSQSISYVSINNVHVSKYEK